MAHYRAVMGTTLDCEGCEFDSEQCKSEEGCVVFTNHSSPREIKWDGKKILENFCNGKNLGCLIGDGFTEKNRGSLMDD